MKSNGESFADRWSPRPSARTRNTIQRSVTALLDELAPERLVTRADRLPKAVEQYRTPSGCVLQAADAALSVSWFEHGGDDAALGELRVLVWSGVVTRRGAPPTKGGATTVEELVLQPMEPPLDGCVWQAANGTRYDNAALAALCTSMLAEQIGKTRSESSESVS